MSHTPDATIETVTGDWFIIYHSHVSENTVSKALGFRVCNVCIKFKRAHHGIIQRAAVVMVFGSPSDATAPSSS